MLMIYLLNLHTNDIFMATTPTDSLQGCLENICKWSYNKSWRFKLLFVQGALNYSILNKRWINLSLCDKCKANIKPLESPLKYWLIQIICFHMVSYIQSKEEKHRNQMNSFSFLVGFETMLYCWIPKSLKFFN